MSGHKRDGHDEGRREFLRQGLRWAAALTLGGGLLALAKDRRMACLNDGACAGCAIYGRCELPAAIAARRE